MAPPIPAQAVPLNVWPCAQVPLGQQWRESGYVPGSALHSAALFPELARRIVVTYSSPGDLVVDPVAGAGVAPIEAARLRRRGVALTLTDASADMARANVRCALMPAQRERVRVVPGDAEAATEDLAEHVGRVSLIATSPPRRRPDLGRLRWDTPRLIAECARLLAPGGILAVVSRIARVGDQLQDTAPDTVAAANVAGLMYLQHVVALTAGLGDGSLIAAGRQLRRGDRCVVTHTDVLAFMKPREARA